MHKRQSLLAFGPGRPLQPRLLRINGVRHRSQILPGNLQRADAKGSNTPPQDPTGPHPQNPTPDTEPTPFNKSNQGRTRQQRAAQVSQEVQMLSRGNPSGTVSGSNSPYPRVRSRGIDAQDAGRAGSSGQMGAGAPADREGPDAQGVGRSLRGRYETDVARSERGVGGAVEEPAAGGVSVMEASRGREGLEEEQEQGAEARYSTLRELQLLEQFDKEEVTAVPFEPEAVTREEFLQLGQGGATIAGGNYEGVVADRLKLLAESTQDGFRWAPDMAKRMMKGEFVSFKSEEEKAAVVAAAEKYAQHNAEKIGEQRGSEEAVERFEHEFAPLDEQTRDATFDKLVRGRYGDLNATTHKHSVLNHIAKATLRNPSYLAGDGEKLLKKVRSLLPTQNAARPAGKAAPRK